MLIIIIHIPNQITVLLDNIPGPTEVKEVSKRRKFQQIDYSATITGYTGRSENNWSPKDLGIAGKPLTSGKQEISLVFECCRTWHDFFPLMRWSRACKYANAETK
jgi:hypothetical protein